MDLPPCQGEAALQRLRSADPPLFLAPSPDLSAAARSASRHLFSSLVPFCPNPPVDRLLADEEFDAEQIWCQIDLLAGSLLSRLRRQVNTFERNPPRFSSITDGGGAKLDTEEEGEEEEEEERGSEGESDDEEEKGSGSESEEEEEEDDEAESEKEDDIQEKANMVEDQFLKIKELEEYLKKGDDEEYNRQGMKRKKNEDADDEDEDDQEDEEMELDGSDDNDDGENNLAEGARYKDFFGGNKKNEIKKKLGGEKIKGSNEVQSAHSSEDVDMQDEETFEEAKQVLSTHEKEQKKLRAEIEQLEKANMDSKHWTLQGEVTAVKRPKNSALEEDLDFEHNVLPAPVITEEYNTTIEDMIKNRIIEGRFDNVQRVLPLPSKAPKERKEMDENKSKKGLAELYEEEYAQKTGLAPAPASVSDELKKEANILFKKLFAKLDTLSHFHFAPKPVIEDMTIQAKVPALAMEEIAPLAVSDAAMLAPEEIFDGKGDIKEESEFTKEDRKRRRANKKRKFRARQTVVAKRDNESMAKGTTKDPNGE